MQITIALAKGRLAEMAEDLLERCGLDVSELREDSRKLVFYDRKNDVRYLLVKPTDVPVYVDHGVDVYKRQPMGFTSPPYSISCGLKFGCFYP